LRLRLRRNEKNHASVVQREIAVKFYQGRGRTFRKIYEEPVWDQPDDADAAGIGVGTQHQAGLLAQVKAKDIFPFEV